MADLAIRATKARKKADEARKSADVAGGGAVPDTQPQAKAALAAEAKAEEAKAEEAKAEEAKAGFAAAKAEATAHFKRGEHSQAAAAFGELIRWCKGGKGGPAGKPLLPASFARQSLPGLLSNRAMCLIEAGKLEECRGLRRRPRSDRRARHPEPPPPGLAFKLSLRRAEANRRLGRMDMVLRASEALHAAGANRRREGSCRLSVPAVRCPLRRVSSVTGVAERKREGEVRADEERGAVVYRIHDRSRSRDRVVYCAGTV